MPTTSSAPSELRMAPPEYYNDFGDVDDDDDDDDVVDIDVDSLGDWRTFRRDLARSGIDGGSSSSSSDGWDGEDEGKKKNKKTTTTKTTTTTGKKREEAARPSSVSKRNEELLRSQSEELAEEYATGVWAHEAPNPEVGGLACRLPLEAELYRNSDYSLIGRKLQGRLSLHDGKEEEEDDDDNDDDDNDGSSSAAPSGDDGTGTQASEPTPPGSSPGVSFSPLAARTVFWYRAAQGLIREEMGRLVASIAEDNDDDNDDDGTGTGTATIDVANLGPESADMLGLYLDHQDAWQEVCLVLDRDEGGGTGKAATTVVLNRPMAFRATENLARLAVMGAYDPTEPTPTEEQARLLTLFLSAFDEEMGMYVGGPDMMEEPALVIHGIRDLEGAEEVAKGTGIYVGGLEAAVEGVAAGRYKPLDFRFFVGRHRYERGGLDLAVRLGKYQPVACARSVALKQCIALPKPLWHEVMELCGGELKEISNLELMKRNDLQIEEADE